MQTDAHAAFRCLGDTSTPRAWWRRVYASRLVETCLCLALGARAQFQFLRSIKPKIVKTIILADHSPAILEMRLSSSVPNVVPDRERPVSRNQGKRQHPVEASDT
ncbi:hypothetical protein NDU88_004523 [Pleurodeles waltl]|uniref:Uncharacterized protein n=1 Tax=Pleurodeles waltl TaxID=8319 RepID=A0AAV7T8M0_PLEWA|nr:hypothetical protein NDU88_004523 [Pleurodeles waltl]